MTAATRPLDILFLGGTGFLGPHQINYALARGHRVTMFNRGSNAGMYGDAVEELTGNRDPDIDDGLSVLQGDRTWDVVIDNSGYVPRHVRASVCRHHWHLDLKFTQRLRFMISVPASAFSPNRRSWPTSTTRLSRK
ncbi:hypothetical protein ACFL1C_08520 [Pseudomonadota bacterium]